MFLDQLRSKDPHQSEKTNRERAEAPVREFIPYACHYDPQTLLTKNGELIQTIKIVGFTGESIGRQKISLRDAVREALYNSLDSDQYAIWFHTIRRRKNLDPGGDFPSGFPAYLNRRWVEHHEWDKKFINELYITVVRQGETVSLIDPKQFMRALWPPAERKTRETFLAEAHECLAKTVTSMLDVLQIYGARILGIREKNGILYSEPQQFLSKLVNLHETPQRLQMKDISDSLPGKKIAFGYNVVEVHDKKTRHFGAMLTVKEYRELSTKALDDFLQLPQELIISQCIDFIDAKKAKAQFLYQKKITDISNDSEMAEISGLNDILNSDRGNPIDYGEHQLTVLVLAEHLTQLDENLETALGKLRELGIVTMREDVKLEECFWSMLPANFAFIRRLHPLNTLRAGGFASLHNFPAGTAINNLWGPAVTVFYTAKGTPYFFNFHDQDGFGHTTLIGPHGAGKTSMLNFLCAEAQKFRPKLFFFDMERGSEVFLQAIGGTHYHIKEDLQNGSMKLNPLLLEATEANRVFVSEWIWNLLALGGAELTENEWQSVVDVTGQLLELPNEHRRLASIAAFFEASGHDSLAKALKPWHGTGNYAWLFDHAEDSLDLTTGSAGFELGNLSDNKLINPVLLYLMHRVLTVLDGSPAIVVLDEAWRMLDNPTFAPKVGPWLETMWEKNTVAILATESAENAAESSITGDIMEHISTQIYFPNPQAGSTYQTTFQLSDREYRLVQRMRKDLRHFLLKHGEDAVVAELNLSDMPDVRCVLAPTSEQYTIYQECLAELGELPHEWLPTYQQRCIRSA